MFASSVSSETIVETLTRTLLLPRELGFRVSELDDRVREGVFREIVTVFRPREEVFLTKDEGGRVITPERQSEDFESFREETLRIGPLE